MSVNKVENWLYFRTVADADNDDGDTTTLDQNPTSMCVPASKLLHLEPNSDTNVMVHFSPIRYPEDPNTHKVGYHHSNTGHDGAKLDIVAGKTQEVMTAIAQAVNSYVNKDGFVVIADDVTTDVNNNTVEAEYISPFINSCGNTLATYSSQHRGIHEYFEVVTPMTADDDDVAASLSIKLNNAILLEAALISISGATNNVGSVALEYHNAAIADDAASGGTEFVGADASGNTSIPDVDLDISSDANDPLIVHSGSAAKVSRQTGDTFFHITAKEDMSSMTGTPQVGVYLKWFGKPAIKV
mgnify:CR=1 FL=1|tara:strand:+ start:120 stop:1016 length:897 start_codon:yes stop_codon:yes gene_type:complete